MKERNKTLNLYRETEKKSPEGGWSSCNLHSFFNENKRYCTALRTSLLIEREVFLFVNRQRAIINTLTNILTHTHTHVLMRFSCQSLASSVSNLQCRLNMCVISYSEKEVSVCVFVWEIYEPSSCELRAEHEINCHLKINQRSILIKGQQGQAENAKCGCNNCNKCTCYCSCGCVCVRFTAFFLLSHFFYFLPFFLSFPSGKWIINNETEIDWFSGYLQLGPAVRRPGGNWNHRFRKYSMQN